jgi:hypothetical protein
MNARAQSHTLTLPQVVPLLPSNSLISTSATSTQTWYPVCDAACSKGCLPYESGLCSESASPPAISTSCPSQSPSETGAVYCVQNAMSASPSFTSSWYTSATQQISHVGIAPWIATAYQYTFSGTPGSSTTWSYTQSLMNDILANGPAATAFYFNVNAFYSYWGADCKNSAGQFYPFAPDASTTGTAGHAG